jgi:iron(II)-dependent oxidoreductase
MTKPISNTKLICMLQDARRRTYELVDGLTAKQLLGPRMGTVKPLRWEIGHVAYFYEYFILRELYGEESILGNNRDNALYDSINVAHNDRWDLALLILDDTKAYMQGVFDKLVDKLAARLDGELASETDSFIYQFGVFHEGMHAESFIWAR